MESFRRHREFEEQRRLVLLGAFFAYVRASVILATDFPPLSRTEDFFENPSRSLLLLLQRASAETLPAVIQRKSETQLQV